MIPSESRKSIQRLFQKLSLEMARNSARLGREVWTSSQDKRWGQCEWGTAVDHTRAGRLSVPSLLHPHSQHHPPTPCMHVWLRRKAGRRSWSVYRRLMHLFLNMFFSACGQLHESQGLEEGLKKMAKIEIL